MFTRSHLQEMKRRYASMYAPLIEEKFEEHCGVCGEQGIEEDQIEEGVRLQVKMALSDAGLKGTWKNNKVYVKKKDVKKAEKALKGNVIYRGKPPIVVGEEVEIDEAGISYTGDVKKREEKPDAGDLRQRISTLKYHMGQSTSPETKRDYAEKIKRAEEKLRNLGKPKKE